MQLSPAGLAELSAASGDPLPSDALTGYFRLSSQVSLRNMHLFDADSRIQRYGTPEEVIAAFVPLRLAAYAARKMRLTARLGLELAQVLGAPEHE